MSGDGMPRLLAQRLQETRERLAQTQQELASLAERQQSLVQEILRLQGALAALESLGDQTTLVTALPTTIPPGN